MGTEQKHIDLRMSLFGQKLRHGGRYADFDMDSADSRVCYDFCRPGFFGFHPAGNRLGFVHCPAYGDGHAAVCRPTRPPGSRCVLPLPDSRWDVARLWQTLARLLVKHLNLLSQFCYDFIFLIHALCYNRANIKAQVAYFDILKFQIFILDNCDNFVTVHSF